MIPHPSEFSATLAEADAVLVAAASKVEHASVRLALDQLDREGVAGGGCDGVGCAHAITIGVPARFLIGHCAHSFPTRKIGKARRE